MLKHLKEIRVLLNEQVPLSWPQQSTIHPQPQGVAVSTNLNTKIINLRHQKKMWIPLNLAL